MRAITLALKAHLAQEVTTLATCWKVVRQDGTVMGFTDNVVDVTVAAVTYSAATGYTPSNIQSSSDLAVDNLDIQGVLDATAVTEEDLIAGVYDYADVYIFMINYEDISQGILKLQRGKLGEITVQNGQFIVEMRSLTQQLQQTIGEVYSVTCRADLGDARCKVVLDPPVWASSTVYAVGDVGKASTYTGRRYVITSTIASAISGGTEPVFTSTIASTTTDGQVIWTTFDSYIKEGVYDASAVTNRVPDRPTETDNFIFGLVTYTSGQNTGLSREVKTDTDGDITTALPFPFTPADGDTFEVYAGCKKRVEDCKTFSTENGTRGNIYNMRAEPYIPGIDEVSKFGGQ